MPDLYWSPTLGLIERRDEDAAWWRVEGHRTSLRHDGHPDALPADAVPLRPVEDAPWCDCQSMPEIGRPSQHPKGDPTCEYRLRPVEVDDAIVERVAQALHQCGNCTCEELSACTEDVRVVLDALGEVSRGE